MNLIKVTGLIKFYLDLILTAILVRQKHISQEDTDTIIRMMTVLADMCDKYGIDRFEEA